MADPAPDPVRFESAATRFQNFFKELSEVFVEREDVLQQIALALLCREHVLITGPPGTAKSQLASAVLRRIFDELTGEPSVFSRQFTESTVQTDLVGPIDFKTLVESGRTQHFTDEGMLGAVHAFLDEVFDGRDMLLRAALNVLQERELKQGTKTTRGRIECSLMTSNRYLSDVLEHSRPTLLAFVDRIAFNGFVPRSFADRGNLAAVLRRHVGTSGGPVLRASLSIQDLDVLQAAVDVVEVDDAMCDAIGALLEMLDAEMNAAVRADPSFVPTRYLSTRTAVRCGRVLRAITVYERTFRPSAPLVAQHRHLAWLRLHLLLSGPSPEAVESLLERETDPNEKRQLAIVRTEREVFERVRKKLPPTPERAKSRPRPAVEPAREDTPISEMDRLEAELEGAIARGPGAIVELLRRVSPLSHGGARDAQRARDVAARATAALSHAALRACLGVRGAPPNELHQASSQLADLADSIDDGTESTRPVARWVRSQALALLEESAARLSLSLLDGLDVAPADRAQRRLAGLEELAAVRDRLIAKGVERAPGAPKDGEDASGANWLGAIDRAEDELVLLLDDALRTAITAELRAEGKALAGRLAALGGEAERLDATEQRLATLRATRPRRDAAGTVKARVLGPRIAALVEAALGAIEGGSREGVVGEIEQALAVLDRSGLRTSISARDVASWAGAAILRCDKRPALDPPTLDHDGYRSLRRSEERLSAVYALAQIALHLSPATTPASSAGAGSSATPALGLPRLRELLSMVPEPVRQGAVQEDIERIERAVRHLERWWERESSPRDDPEAHLTDIVRSKFFRVLLDESALVRFSLEAELALELFPDLATTVPELLLRARALEDRARATVLDLLKRRSDAAWRASLGEGPSKPA